MCCQGMGSLRKTAKTFQSTRILGLKLGAEARKEERALERLNASMAFIRNVATYFGFKDLLDVYKSVTLIRGSELTAQRIDN